MARKQPAQGFKFTQEMIPDSKDLAPVLKQYREDAWEAYQELPFPTVKDEAWRRTSLKGLDFGSIQLPNGQLKKSVEPGVATGVLNEKVISGKSSLVLDHSGVQINISADLPVIGKVYTVHKKLPRKTGMLPG